MKHKGIAKNLASLGIIQIANFVMPLISVPIISRIIGPAKFGAINYVGAIIIYFNIFISYGFNLTATRRVTKDPDNEAYRSVVFSEVFFCQLLLFFVSVLTYVVLVYTVPELATDKRMAIYAFLFCISSVLTQNWVFQAMQNLSKVTIVNLLGKVIFLVGVLSLIRKQEDYYLQPLILSVTQILVSLLSFYWAVTNYNIKLVRVKLARCLSILWNEKSGFLSIIFTTFYTTANIVVLGFCQSKEQVGFFTSGQRLISVAQMVLTLPLAQVFFPIIGRAFNKSRNEGLLTTQKLLPIVLLGSGSPIFDIFYGEAFRPAVPVFKILAFVPVLSTISNVFGVQIMLNLKMDKIYMTVIGIGSVLSVSLNLIIAPRWGFIGCAYNWLFSELIIAASMFFVLLKHNIQPFNFNYFRPKQLLLYFNLKVAKNLS
jgi:O-antigen/teichoic acid export membrane protein